MDDLKDNLADIIDSHLDDEYLTTEIFEEIVDYLVNSNSLRF